MGNPYSSLHRFRWKSTCLLEVQSRSSSQMKEKTIGQGTQLIAVGNMSILKALIHVAACQGCAPGASRSFSSVLVDVLGAEQQMTEYLMSEAARCPNCDRPMFENTLVRRKDEIDERAAEAVREFELNWDE